MGRNTTREISERVRELVMTDERQLLARHKGAMEAHGVFGEQFIKLGHQKRGCRSF